MQLFYLLGEKIAYHISIIVLFILIAIVSAFYSKNNEYVKETLVHGWIVSKTNFTEVKNKNLKLKYYCYS